MEVFYIIIGIIVIIGTVGINLYNRIVKYKIKVEEAASGIDVALAKRYAVLTNTIEVVRGYAKHEADTLSHVVEARSDMTMNQKSACYEEYKTAQTKLFALQESYPDLKANQNFMQLQKTIVDVEEHLQAARRMYNSNVSLYNQACQTFPGNMVAGFVAKKKFDFFMADEAETKNINVKF